MLRNSTKIDSVEFDNTGLKERLEQMTKKENYYVKEIERINSKVADLTSEVANLRSRNKKLQTLNEEMKNLDELHKEIGSWKQKYDQLEKGYKSDLGSKEVNIESLYKTEYVDYRP